jgi:glucose-6-phosphate isomerase
MSKQARTPRNPAGTPAWRNLKQHHKKIADIHLRELFAADPERVSRFSLESGGLYVDYSKHRATDETLSLLLALAEEMQISHAIQELFDGDCVNSTEKRPALHTALRSSAGPEVRLHGKNISGVVQDELARLSQFIVQLHAGAIKGYTGRAIETLVNIGIGGSDLGPRLVTDALRHYHQTGLRIHFVANADPVAINNVLAESSPETTLFIVSSKSFTTQETLANAQRAQQWLCERGCRDVAGHLVAVTANADEAIKLGISPERIFHIWDWVGGRYSVWSAMGLPVAAAIGMDNFRDFLAGAHAMDRHFHSAPLARNIPVILALLDIWYINFFHCASLAVIPYAHTLKLLPRYLGQLVMESNGKSVRRDHGAARYHTSAIVWGGEGTNAQHAFMQLLHQGTHLVPVDFLAGLKCDDDSNQEQHNLLLANCIAQSKALMLGNDSDTQPYKTIAGNKPSTTILYERLTPEILGMLLALYEHRTYVQACLWNINAFDQWGVELGKILATDIQTDLNDHHAGSGHDASTYHLILRYINSTRT